MASVVVLNGTIKGMIPVTPDDNNDVDVRYSQGLYVEVGGNLRCEWADGSIDTIVIPNYSTVQAVVRRLYATGTSATGFHGLRYEM